MLRLHHADANGNRSRDNESGPTAWHGNMDDSFGSRRPSTAGFTSATTVRCKRTFDTLPVRGVPQAKLVVGAPDDPLEHEADRIANQVMRSPESGSFDSRTASAPPKIHRKCVSCEEEDAKIRTFRERAPAYASADARDDAHEALRSSGQPLDVSLRAFFEPRFGHDFSRVRVHADHEAGRISRQLGAKAFTYGPHILFADGRTPARDVLTGHELTHVVQQGAAPEVKRADRPVLPGRQSLTPAAEQRPIQRSPAEDAQALPGEDLEPPGDCTALQYVRMRIPVETAKAIVNMVGRCKPGDTCTFIAFKIAAVMAEVTARVALDNACFRGGNRKHLRQINEKITMYNDCIKAFEKGSGCPPELIKAMQGVVEAARAVIAAGFVAVAVAAMAALLAAIIALVDVILAILAAAAEAAAEATLVAAAAAALMAMLQELNTLLAADG